MEGLVGLLLLGVAATVLVGMSRGRTAGGRGASGRRAQRPAYVMPVLESLTPTMVVVDPDGVPPPRAPARTTRRSSDLLRYGGASGVGVQHTGGYAALGVLTTGYAPMKDAIVELAVVRMDGQGQEVDTFSTLIRPEHGQPAADALGTIDPRDLLAAPTFAEVSPRLLELLSGVVAVTHHGGHVGPFLAARFLQAAVLPEPIPALNLDRFGPGLFGTPNLRAATLARRLDLDYPTPATAADQARLVAACLPSILARSGPALRYPCEPAGGDPASYVVRPTVIAAGDGVGQRRNRPPAATVQPFLADLLALAPIGAQEMNDPRVAAYLEDVATLLVQGRMVKTELADLAQRMARAGTGTEQLRAITARLLESLREAAFRRASLSAAQVRHLRAAATSLGISGYFDDLIPPSPPLAPAPGSGSFARPVRKPPPQKTPPKLPRCGQCLRVGHYTTMCPTPPSGRTLGTGAVEPTGRVGPIRPIERA